MSRIPDEIEGLGRTAHSMRQNPEFDPAEYDFDRDSYFIWSRLDGFTSLRNVILMVGFPKDHTVAILRRLRAVGAILRPGETPASVAALVARYRDRRARSSARTSAAASAPTERATQPTRATRPTVHSDPSERVGGHSMGGAHDETTSDGGAPADVLDAWNLPTETSSVDPAELVPEPEVASGTDALEDLDDLDDEEAAALAVEVELSEDLKRRIIIMRRRASRVDYFTLFGVEPDAGRRELKRAYFRLSKEFHPDRYYRRDTGPFGPWLAEIFATVNDAFEVLSNQKSRRRYKASLTGEHRVRGSQTMDEYADDLFDRACNTETGGDLDQALRLFAAAIRIDARSRYLARAARCATAAGALDIAEEYASKAAELEPWSPSVARILADVYRAAGKLERAEATLLHALGLKSENDVLHRELAADLSEVRAALEEGG